VPHADPRFDEPMDPARCMNGETVRLALHFALLACPTGKGEELEHLRHVLFHGPTRRVVTGDSFAWHEARLVPDFPAWHSFAATRRSVDGLVGHLDNVVRQLKRQGVEDSTYFVEFMPWDPTDPDRTADRWFRIHYGTFPPVVWPLKQVGVGPIPVSWDPPVPEEEVRLTGIGEGRRVAAEFVSRACGWPGDGVSVAWRGSGTGPVRFDLEGREGVVASATVLPVGQRATLMDERQEELFRVRAQHDPGRSVLALRLDYGPGPRTTPCEHGTPPEEQCLRCAGTADAASEADTPGLRAAVEEFAAMEHEETGTPARAATLTMSFSEPASVVVEATRFVVATPNISAPIGRPSPNVLRPEDVIRTADAAIAADSQRLQRPEPAGPAGPADVVDLGPVGDARAPQPPQPPAGRARRPRRLGG
jgi:hypothetical protein